MIQLNQKEYAAVEREWVECEAHVFTGVVMV